MNTKTQIRVFGNDKTLDSAYPKDSARWVGGMCHELGHCFGLPDATSTDGTVMSASFYSWPNCVFTSAMATTMQNLSANSGFWTTEITGTADFPIVDRITQQLWTLMIRGNRLEVAFTQVGPFIATIGIYDLLGKSAARFSPVTEGKSPCRFDVGNLGAGTYICSLEKDGKIKRSGFVKKLR